MSAFQMVARCSLQQWRGLTEAERCWLTENWNRDLLPSAGVLKLVSVGQIETPIWSVTGHWAIGLTLMSVKEDVVEDVPKG